MEFTKFEKVIKINGINVDVEIEIRVEEDDITPDGDFDFGDAEENAAYLRRFKSGELFIAVISVNARALGERGNDCLGGCHIHSNNLFDSTLFESDVNSTIREHTMVSNAVEDLKTSIVNKAKLLKGFVE